MPEANMTLVGLALIVLLAFVAYLLRHRLQSLRISLGRWAAEMKAGSPETAEPHRTDGSGATVARNKATGEGIDAHASGKGSTVTDNEASGKNIRFRAES